MITDEDWADIYELAANLQARFARLAMYDKWRAASIPRWVSL